MVPFSQAQWSPWAYSGVEDPYSGYQQLPNYPGYLAESMDVYQAHQNHLIHHHHMSRTTESKPRLSKEEVEVLEAEFQKNHKPNSSTKKALAESMRVDNARINNWFQNRRAREKKENNIREYEARQKLEKEKTEAETGHPVENDRRRDLVASSAPFPEPRRPSHSQMQALDSPSDQSTFDLSSETTDSIHCTDTDDPSSPFVPTPQTLSSTGVSHMQRGLDGSMNGVMSEQMRDYLAMSEAGLDMQGANVDSEMFLPLADKNAADFFGEYQGFMAHNEEGKSTQQYSQHLFPGDQQQNAMQYQDTAYLDQDISSNVTAQPSPMSTGSRLKSPPPVDIASRRNRRPPPLTISGARSYSACVPKTAADMNKRGEQSRTMRRVASATGPMRVTKPNVTPRSPFFDRRAEGMLRMSRSPSSGGPGAAAPPTPNTPAAGNQFGLGGKRPSAGWAVHDPTLRTPPSTPGLMDSLFNLNSGYGMSMPDDALITPGVASFPGEFEIPSSVSGAPGYIGSSNGGSSQPDTPSYGPGMGPACFNFFGGNTDYNWSDASASAKSSPALNPDQVQFMNMAATTFKVGQ